MKLRRICKVNYAGSSTILEPGHSPYLRYISLISGDYCGVFLLTTTPGVQSFGIFIFALMPPDSEAKRKALQASGTFNPRAARVQHPLFQQSPFFDPEDLLQLKYETVRALEVESCPLARAARDFGLSRPTIYEAQNQ